MSMPFSVRKYFLAVEEVRAEGGRTAEEPLVRVVSAAVIANPMAGQFGDDLSQMMAGGGPLAAELGARALGAMGGRAVSGVGKGAIVGTAGQPEHGIAIITNAFGDAFRASTGGRTWVCSNVKRAAPGAAIDIPLAHKDALFVRDNYDTVEVTVPDAPLADEIVVIAVLTNRGRLHARLGGLKAADIKGDGLR